MAEFQNYRRRIEREQNDLRHRASLDTLASVLPIIDDFERALANVPEEFEDTPWVIGVSLIRDKFKKLLEDHDIVPINPIGEEFDPSRHQAISKEDSDEFESNHVIETLQMGYISGNVLLRPALVRIAN
jgi:molecular chaperone GrpE